MNTELDILAAILTKCGYRFETVETPTDTCVKMIRPDGSVAITARKPKEKSDEGVRS